MGDCRAAVAAFTESERQGKISRIANELNTLQDRRSQCQDLIDSTEAAARQARLLVSEGEEAAGQVVRLHRDPQIALVWENGEPSFSQRQADATSLLVEGRRAVEEGFRRLDPNRVAAGQETVAQAVEAFAGLISDLHSRRDELSTLFASGVEGVEQLGARAERALAEMPDVNPVPPQLRDAQRRLEQALVRAEGVTARTAVQEIEEIRQELAGRLSAFRAASASPPTQLLAAADALFRGDFEGALAQLPDQESRDNRINAHACLFRAAAWHGLYWSRGAVDPDLLSQACREAERCHELADKVSPHPDFFSPTFVVFFEENAPLPDEAIASEQ
jgi:hypothetical protein